MPTIILLATVHKERGNCNSNELLKIIERIAPDVVFEEVPPSKFVEIYEGGSRRDSLETETIKTYLHTYPIAHFPVDLDIDELNEEHFLRNAKKMLNTFDQYPDIMHLRCQEEEMAARYGFPYLNSEKYTVLSDHRKNLEKNTVRIINHQELSEIYKNWLDIINKREMEMIRKVYDYVATYNYNRGLLLVGAEHKKPIIEKIPAFENSNTTKLSWDFNFLNQ